MAKEIEHKFLVCSERFKELTQPVFYHQGYICADASKVVRVRIEGDRAKLTVKGRHEGLSRDEYEYDIPMQDAEEMLERICHHPTISKFRYKIPYAGFVWEVDVFQGENEGLIVAEIEVPSEDTVFEKPDWIGVEVTGIPCYYNSSLVMNPYSKWRNKDKI